MPLLQGKSEPLDDSLVKWEPGFRAITFDELSDRMIIGSLGTWIGQAVKHSRLRLLKVRELRTDLDVRLRFTLLFAIVPPFAVANSMVQNPISIYRTLPRFSLRTIRESTLPCLLLVPL